MPERKRPTLVVAADVFGATDDLRRFAASLAPDAMVVSPHADGRVFADEAQGYAALMAQGGVQAYARRLATELTARPPRQLAVGFSAGASALWFCLCVPEFCPRIAMPEHAALYYGSRIREAAHLRPRAMTTRLVFAEREASFDPAPLAATLSAAGLDASVIPGSAHGFMNPLSAGYDARLCAKEKAKLAALLA